MVVRVTHSKVSGKPQGSDPARVYGNHWDEDHVVEGLDIGTDVQAHDDDLDAIAALTPSDDDIIQRKGGTWANRSPAQYIADLGALGTTFQPLDSDLTAIAALSTTSYGRGLLTLANAAALAAEVDPYFLTPAEGNAAYQPLDSDLTAIAALSTTSYGRAFLALADAAAARTAIGAGTIATQDANNVSITGGSVSGITDLAIADGGTGQSTATAGFDALAPTTTRGDIIFRNATTNTRLAASTAGYHLQTNGAASDPTYAGFLQVGTGAATRTWNAKARDIVSAKDFGVVADGSTTDTTNLQAAIDAAAAAGLALYLPSGRYKTGNLTLPATGDVTIFGDGRTTVLVAATDGVTFFTMSDAFAATHKTFRGLSFDGNGGVNCRGVSCTQTRETKVIDCHFEDLKYNVLVNECRGFWLSDISCLNSGAFYFHSTSDLGYCKDVMAVNIIDPIGTDINTTYGINAWFYLKDVVNGGLVNCSMAGMDGNSRCYNISGKTEGVFLHNCVVGWPSVGLFMEGIAYVTQGATIYPQYCGFVNCGFDQPSVSSAIVVGDYNYMTGCWLANGTTRTNTGDGVTIKANTISFKMKDCYIAYHQKDGIKIESGATGVLIDGCDFTNNNGSAGSFYDIDAASAARADVKVVNCSPGLTSSIGNQIIVNGNTSSILSRNLTAASTTAVTTAEDLLSYTIAANTLKIGQRVRVRAWGTVAANANTKTGRLWFGSANLGGWTGTLNNIGWKIDAEITITGSATQEYLRESLTSSTQITRGDLTQSISSTIVVKFQGQNGTASAGDITCDGLTVEILD